MTPSAKSILISYILFIFLAFACPLLSFEGKVFSVTEKNVVIVGDGVSHLKSGQKFGVYSGEVKTGEVLIQQASDVQAKAVVISGNAGKDDIVKKIVATLESEAGEYGEMIFVRGGTFEMGDTFSEGYEQELPVHSVIVSDFYMGKTELTRGEFRAFVHATLYETTEERDNNSSNTWRSCWNIKQTDAHPVICVSFYDAVEYCNWRSKKEGLTPVYSKSFFFKKVKVNGEANGYRLPTEAEWEYAARSGGKKEKFSGTSNAADLGEFAWYSDNSKWSTHPAGEKKANGLGINDLSGNVEEWVWDRYDHEYYKKINKMKFVNPVGPDSGKYRVLRGGSWYNNPFYSRAAYRYQNFPFTCGMNVGFRLARSAR